MAMLATPAIDVGCTASAAGAHAVPVSLAWVDERVVIAVEGTWSPRAHLTASGEARLAVGPTPRPDDDRRVLETAVKSRPTMAGGSVRAQADWDPRRDSGYVFLVLRPVRVQAWREANEIAGRTLMRDGAWLV